jgi:cation diffusion facilitator family transporter
MSSISITSEATREKSQAALSSVIAAVGLTAFKIIVGALTGSLGILAEAAHSGLDLVAAVITFLAVRISGKPADEEHLYGHGKIENLSALFETLLLLATCVWIIYEAYRRLFVEHVEVEVSIWAYIVMVVSIIIDTSRSRVLSNAAKKHNSQALEADALHFSTDIWSSSVVIVGLVCVTLSKSFASLSFLKQADAIAAVGVAFIVIYISIELGIRTIKGLLDSAPVGLVEKITTTAKNVPGVTDCHKVRVRPSGAHLFIDAHVVMDGSLSLDEAHALTEKIQSEVHKIAPEIDFTVHAEPLKKPIKSAE